MKQLLVFLIFNSCVFAQYLDNKTGKWVEEDRLSKYFGVGVSFFGISTIDFDLSQEAIERFLDPGVNTETSRATTTKHQTKDTIFMSAEAFILPLADVKPLDQLRIGYRLRYYLYDTDVDYEQANALDVRQEGDPSWWRYTHVAARKFDLCNQAFADWTWILDDDLDGGGSGILLGYARIFDWGMDVDYRWDAWLDRGTKIIHADIVGDYYYAGMFVRIDHGYFTLFAGRYDTDVKIDGYGDGSLKGWDFGFEIGMIF